MLAIGIRDAYGDLFKVYPDANKRDREILTNFFTTNTNVARTTVACIVRTFETLCELADFSFTPSKVPTIQAIESPTVELPAEAIEKSEIPPTAHTAQEVTINVNIQLTLPETRDGSVYNRTFESLKKHLLS